MDNIIVIERWECLIGKTIENAEVIGTEEFDDVDYLLLTFTDGSSEKIAPSYGGYTGRSRDEYRVQLDLLE